MSAASFTAADVSNTGSATGVTWSITQVNSTTFTVGATGSGNGTLIPRIALAGVTDSAGNANTSNIDSTDTVSYSGAAFTASISVGSGQSTSVNTLPMTFTVVFSSAANSGTFSSVDITNQGSIASGNITWAAPTSADNVTWTIQATAITGNGTVIPMIAASAVQDTFGNNNAGATGSNRTVTYDTTGPTIAYTTVSPASPSATLTPTFYGSANETSTVTLYFDSACTTAKSSSVSNTVFASPGITLTSNVTANGATQVYARAVDSLGNAGACATLGGTYTHDNTSPTVLSVTSTTANGSFKSGGSIGVRVVFSETVTVAGGTPRITLETGTTDAVVNYASTATTTLANDTLLFTYIVGAGENSGDLDYVSTSALALNGATIRDAVGNNAVLTLPAVAGASSLSGQRAFVVDTTAPTVYAGADVTLTAATAIADATASDAGSGISTYAWSTVTNPGGTVTLSSSSVLNPTFTSATVAGSYTMRLTVTDGALNSATDDVVIQWATTPSAPTVTSTSPTITAVNNRYLSNGASLTFNLGCTTGYSVILAGDVSAGDVTGGNLTKTCSASAASFIVNKSTANSYALNFTQKDTTTNVSSTALALVWQKVATVTTPTITFPLTSSITTNKAPLFITGTCSSGDRVTLSGPAATDIMLPLGQLSQICINGSYAYQVAKASAGSLGITVGSSNVVNTGFTSSNASLTWAYDPSLPDAPTLTSQSTNFLRSGDSTITLSGGCTSGNTVQLSGSSTSSTTCSNSAYSFAVSQSVDATYTFNITQINGSAVESGPVQFQWVRDTSLPTTPTISSPTSSFATYYSNSNTLTVSGACTTGNTVLISGDVRAAETGGSLSATCSASAYTITVTKTSATNSVNTYNFGIAQRNGSNVVSAPIKFTWIYDTLAPVGPNIIQPFYSQVDGTYGSSDTTLTIAGTCEPGSTVNTSTTFTTPASSDTMSATCVNGSFTMTTPTKSSDATYTYVVYMTDGAGNVTHSALRKTISWVKAAASPASPTVTTPTVRNFVSNGNTVTISGTCTSNVQVYEGGSGTASTCTSGAYSYTSGSKSLDGIYTYRMTQNTGTVHGKTSVQWTRDTIAPVPPVIKYPLVNPHTHGDNIFDVTGTCEPQSTIALAGASNQTATCTDRGFFTLPISNPYDGTYNYMVYSVDAAGNTSLGVPFQSVRNTAGVLPTPVVSSHPWTTSYVPTGGITITGSCAGTNTVTIGGSIAASEVTGNSLTTTCASNGYSFIVTKTADGTYPLTFVQSNSSTGQTSTPAFLEMVRDTSAPTSLTITNATAGTVGDIAYVGNCEANALVTVNFTTETGTASFYCLGGAYRVPIQKTAGASFTGSIQQTDIAGNNQSAISYSWTKSTLATYPVAPTLLSPAPRTQFNTYYYYPAASSAVTYGGDCTAGLNVYYTDTGNSVSAAEQNVGACPASGMWTSASQSAIASPNTGRTITTRTLNTNYSSLNYRYALYDNSAPTAPTVGTTQNGLRTAVSVTSSDYNSGLAYLYCAGDNSGTTFYICNSSYTANGWLTGSHNFYGRVVDFAGNANASNTTQPFSGTTYSTLALYHFDDSAAASDHSGYNGSQALTSSATTGTGKFQQGRTFGSSKSASVANLASQNVGLANSMTVEAYIYPTSAVTAANTYIVNKSGASSNYGWYLGYRGTGSTMNLVFAASADGTTAPTQILSPSTCTFATNTWIHVAAVWNNGTIKFYCDGAYKGMGIFGTVGTSTINASTSTLDIGVNQAVTPIYFNGVIDEVRISQFPQDSGVTFPLPTVPYDPD
jgi:hypothetical protein